MRARSKSRSGRAQERPGSRAPLARAAPAICNARERFSSWCAGLNVLLEAGGSHIKNRASSYILR